MKKGLIYLFMLVMSASVFTACSDDDNDMPKNEEFKAEKLKLNFNGKDLTEKSVNFTQINETEAEVALKYLIPGEDSLIVSLKITEPVSRAYDNYDLSGENKTADRVVKVSGSLVDGVLNLKTTFEITNTNIIGEWQTIYEFSSTGMTTSLHLDIKNDKDSVMLPIWNEKVAGSDLGQYLGLVGTILPQILDKVELTKEGKLIAYYYEDLSAKNDGKSPIKEDQNVTYNISNGMIYIKADLSAVMPTGRANSPTIDITSMLKSGIPLKYIITENNNLRVYVDKNMMLPFMPIIEMLAPSLEGIELPDMGIEKGSISKFLLGIIPVISNAEKAEIGLEVKRVAIN